MSKSVESCVVMKVIRRWKTAHPAVLVARASRAVDRIATNPWCGTRTASGRIPASGNTQCTSSDVSWPVQLAAVHQPLACRRRTGSLSASSTAVADENGKAAMR
jgi:hypothetical protein